MGLRRWLSLATVAALIGSSSTAAAATGVAGASTDPRNTSPTPAPGTTLYTDAVTYCAEPVAVIVEAMDISYHK